MEFLLLIYGEEKIWQNKSKAETDAVHGEYGAFGKAHSQSIKGGNALQSVSTAATVRVRDGKQLTTDGPFGETKEQLAGSYLVEAKDRDEAVAIGAKIPGARSESIEVRPIMRF